MAAEHDLREKLKARVESHGGEIRALAYLGRNHCPDVLVLLPHRHVFIETKAPGKAPNGGQLREHDRMRFAGCDVRVISTNEELDRWLPPRKGL